MFVGGFSCLCLLSPVARTHAARPHRNWKTQGRVQRSSPPLQAPHATSARVNRWRSPRAGWLSLCLSPTMGERCHSPFTSAELAAVSPVPRSIGARCGSSSCAAGLSTPAAAALRFVVSRLGERGPRCRLGAACLVGDGHRLRFSPGPGESAFSSATGARLRVGLFAAIGGREADSHDKATA